MRRKVKATVRLFDDDLETLRRYYPKAGYNAVVRGIVSLFCRKLRERSTKMGVPHEPGTINLSADDIASLGDGAGDSTG